MPGKQLLLIGMGGKTVDGVDTGIDRNFVIKNPHFFRAVNNQAGQGALGGKADKDHRRFALP